MTHRLVRAGGKIVEFPIEFRDRRAGDSKLSQGIVGEAVGLVLAERAHLAVDAAAAEGHGAQAQFRHEEAGPAELVHPHRKISIAQEDAENGAAAILR